MVTSDRTIDITAPGCTIVGSQSWHMRWHMRGAFDHDGPCCRRRSVMYLRLTRGRFDATHADEVREAVPAIAAALRGLPGVQDVRVGIDRASGRTLSLTTFDTVEHAQF